MSFPEEGKPGVKNESLPPFVRSGSRTKTKGKNSNDINNKNQIRSRSCPSSSSSLSSSSLFPPMLLIDKMRKRISQIDAPPQIALDLSSDVIYDFLLYQKHISTTPSPIRNKSLAARVTSVDVTPTTTAQFVQPEEQEHQRNQRQGELSRLPSALKSATISTSSFNLGISSNKKNTTAIKKERALAKHEVVDYQRLPPAVQHQLKLCPSLRLFPTQSYTPLTRLGKGAFGETWLMEAKPKATYQQQLLSQLQAVVATATSATSSSSSSCSSSVGTVLSNPPASPATPSDVGKGTLRRPSSDVTSIKSTTSIGSIGSTSTSPSSQRAGRVSALTSTAPIRLKTGYQLSAENAFVCKMISQQSSSFSQVASEVNILANVAHPCIVAFVEGYVETGKMNLVMEYVDGGDLKKEIDQRRVAGAAAGGGAGGGGGGGNNNNQQQQRGGGGGGGGGNFIIKMERRYAPEQMIVTVFAQICLALEYLHTHNILHRDMKSENIILSKKYLVKLGDFGLAKNYSQDVSLSHGRGGYAGTPGYVSPEVCRREGFSEKSDMWSVGVILHELIMLEAPFPKSHIIYQHANQPAPAPAAQNLNNNNNNNNNNRQGLEQQQNVNTNNNNNNQPGGDGGDQQNHRHQQQQHQDPAYSNDAFARGRRKITRVDISNDLRDLCDSLLNPNPDKRPSALECLRLPFIQKAAKSFVSSFSRGSNPGSIDETWGVVLSEQLESIKNSENLSAPAWRAKLACRNLIQVRLENFASGSTSSAVSGTRSRRGGGRGGVSGAVAATSNTSSGPGNSKRLSSSSSKTVTSTSTYSKGAANNNYINVEASAIDDHVKQFQRKGGEGGEGSTKPQSPATPQQQENTNCHVIPVSVQSGQVSATSFSPPQSPQN